MEICLQNVSVTAQGRSILRDLNFLIPAQKLTCIVGPSGTGKTTLLRCFNRLVDEDPSYRLSGTILLGHEDILARRTPKYELRRRIGLVFQKPVVFPISIYKNVIFGLKHVSPLARRHFPEVAEKCLRDAFLWDEVKDRLHDSALKLSLGQQQRLSIARTLAVSPEVLLMDEPTSSLDERATRQIEQLIDKIKGEKTLVMVTHNLEQAQRISDQIIRLVPGPEGARSELVQDFTQAQRYKHEAVGTH